MTDGRSVRAFSPLVVLRPELVLAGLMAAGLGFRVWRAWESIPTLVLKITADDAYYYFQIALNIANGRNVTFDGETVTNGFHPLWMVLLTPVYFFTNDREVALHVGLTLSAALGTATIAVVYLIGRQLTKNGWASLIGAGFFALHPYIVVDSVNGMETAVAVFTLGLTVLQFLRIVEKESAGFRDYALLGAAGGLMLLARTDTVFVLGAVLLFLAWRELGHRRWRLPVLAGSVAVLVVGPWLVWSLVSVGTVIQVSGVAVPDFDRQIFLHIQGNELSTQAEEAWEVTKDALFDDLVHLYFVPPRVERRLPFLLASAGLLCFMLAAPLSPQRRRVARQLGVLAVPVAGVLAMLLFHAAIRWHLREWYYGPVSVLASVAITVVAGYAQSLLEGTSIGWRAGGGEGTGPAAFRLGAQQRWLALLALYGVIGAILLFVYGPQEEVHWVDRRARPHRLNMLEGAEWLRENTTEGTRIGSLNAGIFGYFSERTVVNLDGVVNADAFKARLDCRTSEYMLSERLTLFADVEAADGFATIDADGLLACGGPPCLSFTLLAEIGKTLAYFGGAQVDVLDLEPDPSAPCETAATNEPASRSPPSQARR